MHMYMCYLLSGYYNHWRGRRKNSPVNAQQSGHHGKQTSGGMVSQYLGNIEIRGGFT